MLLVSLLKCYMVLKRIITRNIQNHREVVIELPKTGLIVFSGPNSNGKSVIGKAIKSTLNGDLHKPRKRAALVSTECTYGTLTLERDDGVELFVCIAIAAKGTYVRYTEPNKEPITRYLADKSYLDLVCRFGLHYDSTTGVSLNIAEADEALLFYKTSHKVNGSTLKTATTDAAAEKTALSFENTLKEARKSKDEWIQKMNVFNDALSSLKIEDIDKLSKQLAVLSSIHKNLSAVKFPTIKSIVSIPNVRTFNFYTPKLPVIKKVPDVKYLEVYIPKLKEIKYPNIVDINYPKVKSVSKVVHEIEELRNQTCPTCGRRFNDV